MVDGSGGPVGILTERDVIKRVVAAGVTDISAVPVSAVMTPAPVTLSPEETIFRALSVLSQTGIKHLPLARAGKLEGIVTLRQLLRLRHPEPSIMIGRIQEARTAGELKAIRDEMPLVAASKLSVGLRAHDVAAMISMINQEIHRRAFELAVEGLGSPPASFCLFLTGSHGRMENLLATDQDHGMVISDEGSHHEEYFMELSRVFSEMLVEVGYEACPGYVMSVNPTWRKTISEWKEQLSYWFERQVPNLARYVTVFYDSIPVYGDFRLFGRLREFAFGLLGTHHEVFRVLHEEEGGHRVPTGIMGRFITEKSGSHKGELDVKRSGLIFVVEGVRILALRHGIRETSTLQRLAALVEKDVINPDDAEYYEEAYRFLLHYALVSQVDKAQAGRKPDTYINPSRLSARDREMLRHAFKAVSSLQGQIALEFGELSI